MLSVHVNGKLTPKSQDSFYAHTLRNAMNSVKEPGISRFDVLSKIDCDDEFLLIEVYNSDDAPVRHKETSHYNSWREDVMITCVYTTLFPKNPDWMVAEASVIELFVSGEGRRFLTI